MSAHHPTADSSAGVTTSASGHERTGFLLSRKASAASSMHTSWSLMSRIATSNMDPGTQRLPQCLEPRYSLPEIAAGQRNCRAAPFSGGGGRPSAKLQLHYPEAFAAEYSAEPTSEKSTCRAYDRRKVSATATEWDFAPVCKLVGSRQTRCRHGPSPFAATLRCGPSGGPPSN